MACVSPAHHAIARVERSCHALRFLQSYPLVSYPPSDGNKPARVNELDGLRGLLALWVALSHIAAWTGHWENPLPGPTSRLWGIFVGAVPAVDTFIILSGFVISFLLHQRRQTYWGFMRGRAFRIYPVYLSCLALAIATSVLTPGILQTASWRETVYFRWIGDSVSNQASAFGYHVFWHLTLLNGLLPKNFLPGANGALLVPAWSITLEWQYYLVAPLLARGVRSGVGLLAIGLTAWLGKRYAGPWHNELLAFLPAHLPLFLIGIASYHLYASRRNSSSELRPLSSAWVVAPIMMGVIAGWHPVALALWGLGFGCIMVRGDDIVARAISLIRSILLHKSLQYLGKISFPVYLVHWPVIVLMLAIVIQVKPDASAALALALLTLIGVPVILLTAAVVHHLIEKPCMDLGKRLERRHPPVTSADLHK